jgi:hypothetical protein
LDLSAPSPIRRTAAWIRTAIALFIVAATLLAGLLGVSLHAPSVRAADAAGSITLDARALLAGNVRPGSWAAVSVLITNAGPSLNGELRIRSSQQGRSQYGLAVELPSGARQGHILYAQPPLFGSRLHVDFVSGGQTLISSEVPIRSHEAWSPTIAIVAERPEGIQAGIVEVGRNPQGNPASVITLTAADLPPRVEAWSVIDRLVWQDVDAGTLEPEQIEALRLWVGAGGRLVIVAGTTGVAPVRGFPEELLPFRPTQTVQVAPDELTALVGQGAGGPSSVPALSGILREGTALARSAAGDVVAAQMTWGQGTVTLVGINPAERWVADANAGRALWRRVLPLGSGPSLNPLSLPEDSMLVSALNNLPSVDLPPIGQLFVLLFAYVALIGPVNYLVLRRLDKREWAWVTMPLLVAVFTVVSYGLGATIKGSDVIVNQVAIVRAGQGTGEGLGQVYVGVFSPSRRTFEVRVPGGALLSNPTSQFQFGQTEQALDILFGDPSRLRNFEVGFGVLRGFRAEAPTAAPLIGSDLRLVRGRLEGTVTNSSDELVEQAAVIFGSGVAVLADIGPGETRSVSLDTTTSSIFGYALSERIFGSSFPRDQAEARVVYTRRTVIDQLSSYGPSLIGAATDRPVLLAWRRAPVLEVELVGERPNNVGDSLYMVPLGLTIDRQAVFGDQMITKSVIESTGEGWGDTSGFYIGRGTMVVEARPQGFDGTFRVSSLEIALTQGDQRDLRGSGTSIEPLPQDKQPDQDDPLGEPPDPLAQPRWEDPPDVQLFDHQSGRWQEFPRLSTSRNYLVAEPSRYVDDAGRILARFVNRAGVNEQKWFTFLVRLEGTIE